MGLSSESRAGPTALDGTTLLQPPTCLARGWLWARGGTGSHDSFARNRSITWIQGDSHVVDTITSGKGSDEARITFQFDQVRLGNRTLPITTNLRAVASPHEVLEAYLSRAPARLPTMKLRSEATRFPTLRVGQSSRDRRSWGNIPS
jgi:hypothetical protein